jgi:hypothetical protein
LGVGLRATSEALRALGLAQRRVHRALLPRSFLRTRAINGDNLGPRGGVLPRCYLLSHLVYPRSLPATTRLYGHRLCERFVVRRLLASRQGATLNHEGFITAEFTTQLIGLRVGLVR